MSLRLHPRGIALALAAALLGAGASPAAAQASFIVYRCGAAFENLCRIAPNGSAQAQLTTDGQPDPGQYASPSLSLDGSRLAFRKGDKLFVGNASATGATEIDPGNFHREVALRPDGLKVATIEFGTVFGPRSDAYAINSDGSGAQFVHTTALTVGWLGSRLLSNPSTETKSVCAYLYENDERMCERTVASDPARDLFHPTGSPDGAFVAAAAVAPSDSAGVIAIYDQATGALVRDLTAGTSDSWPTYSPDGTRIAFQRGDSIFVTPASGGPGGEKMLVPGREPTWGGGPDPPGPGPALVSALKLLGHKKARSGFRFQLRLARPATIEVALDRLTGTSRAGARRVGVVRFSGKSGLNVFTVRKVKHKSLRPGRYTVTVTAIEGATRSPAGKLKLKLKR